MCQLHFAENDLIASNNTNKLRLRPGAVPSIFNDDAQTSIAPDPIPSNIEHSPTEYGYDHNEEENDDDVEYIEILSDIDETETDHVESMES